MKSYISYNNFITYIYRIIHRITVYALVCIFTLSGIVLPDRAEALAPRLGNESVKIRRGMVAHYIANARVTYAEKDDVKAQEELNGADAVLRKYGEILVF